MSVQPRSDALLDSNVLVAAIVENHPDHAPSVALFERLDPSSLHVAGHSYAEAYSTLTQRDRAALFRRSADEAWTALERVAAITRLVGLTPAQTFAAIRAYAGEGGIGPRLYDRLVGAAAVAAGAGAIVTWNTGHMRSLFPNLCVVTPAEHLERMEAH